MKHINIPIFIPHLGCPNQCIFCNQKYISGNESFNEERVETEIIKILSTVDNDDTCEIAFFGGSFTGIDRELMIRLLETAQNYVNSGKVSGIRMSTRPDYISKEIIDILKRYSVNVVELGIQTMNDEILKYLKRGHTVEDTVNAIHMLNDAKIPFIGQMMIGLPKSTLEEEIYCAKRICELGASGARIYPTLVFRMTELEKITSNNEYAPLSIEQAVSRCAEVLNIFRQNNVPCIRIGLCDSDNLHSSDTFVAGPNSPSIGEMVKSRLFLHLISEKLIMNEFDDIIIECAKGKASQVIGNKKENINKLKTKYNLKSIKVIENDNLTQYDTIIKKKEEA